MACHIKTSILLFKKRKYPIPETAWRPPLDLARLVVRLPHPLLMVSTGKDLLCRPLPCPYHFAVVDDVVRAAWKLPVTNRGPKRRAVAMLLDFPFGRCQRRSNLGAAAACTKVGRSLILVRDIQHTFDQNLGHVMDLLQGVPIQNSSPWPAPSLQHPTPGAVSAVPARRSRGSS